MRSLSDERERGFFGVFLPIPGVKLEMALITPVKAMKSGKVFALGLDVYNGEPKINSEYLKLNNLFLLPHLGSATVRTRIDMGDRAIDNLENFFQGKKPKDQVNEVSL